MIVNQTIPELLKIKAEGKAKSIGISAYPLNVLAHVARRVKVDFVLTYAHYTLQNTLLEKYMSDFEAAGCAVIAASPLCLGYFRSEGPPEFHFASAEMKALVPAVNAVCQKYNLNVSHLATKFAMQSPLAKSHRICNTLIGISKASEVEETLLCLEEYTDVEKKAISEILEVLKPFHNYSWKSGNQKYKDLV